MSLVRPVVRSFTLITLAGLLIAFGAGCGSTSENGETGSGQSAGQEQSNAQTRVEARAEAIAARRAARKAAVTARAEARRAAARARAAARRAKLKARAADRRVRIRARALARNGGDVDCGAFVSQAQAQRYLLAGDPFGLDGDGDGVACASLPCPCSVAGGGGSGSDSDGNSAAPPQTFQGTVVSVADGDTLDVTTPSGGVETIRIIGIDTPEVYGGEECGGPAASAAMKRLATGRQVRVTSDPTQDRRDHYGRLLAYIDRGNQDLGFTMVKRGLASAYPYDGPFQRYPRYAKADQQAQNQNRGSWANCDISPG